MCQMTMGGTTLNEVCPNIHQHSRVLPPPLRPRMCRRHTIGHCAVAQLLTLCHSIDKQEEDLHYIGCELYCKPSLLYTDTEFK